MKIAPWALAAFGGLILLAGCGLAANPQPPTLWLPEPVKDLTATRAGDQVHLHWTMPKETTDKVPLKGPQRAHICWTTLALTPSRKPTAPVAVQACRADGDAEYPPQKPADFIASMPAEITSGPPHAVSYVVELENHAGKTAGPSNSISIATGAAPPAMTGLRLEARAEGIVLRWDPAAPPPSPQTLEVLRIHRMLVTQPASAKASQSAGAAPPEQQVLEVDLDKNDPGQALDRDATLDHVWRYTAERVLRVQVDKKPLEIAGLPSSPVTIDAKDVFPPHVPEALAAVPDEQAHAIDLSWAPDTDPDLAGYIVYRRDLAAGSAAERISPKAPVVPPSFVDTHVEPGHRYAWSVSAIDQDGNESARSPETEEQLPQ
jgi:hypothetical protein